VAAEVVQRRLEEAVRVREDAVAEAPEVQQLHPELAPEQALTPRLVIAAPSRESVLPGLLLSRARRSLLRRPAQ
jgi:hypothetical protein